MWFSSMVRTIHVSPSGSDANSGVSSASPVLTLNAAFTKLAGTGGGRVVVHSTPGAPLATWELLQPAVDITIEPASGAWYMNVATTTCLSIAGGRGMVTLESGNFTAATTGVIIGGGASGTGYATAIDCFAQGGTNGWQTLAEYVTFDATGCTGLGGTNDGFNLNGSGTVTLTDCIGDDCGDEGVSPHDSCHLILRATGAGRSHFNRNHESGMAAVASARCDIYGPVLFEGNGLGGFYGGVFYYDHAYGTIGEYTPGDGGPIFRNNVKWGINADGTDGTMTYGTYTSTGNGLADLL